MRFSRISIEISIKNEVKKIRDNVYEISGSYNKKKLLADKPEKLFKLAVRGMLPKTKLGREMIKKLKVYAGSEHPHTAQIAKKEGK